MKPHPFLTKTHAPLLASLALAAAMCTPPKPASAQGPADGTDAAPAPPAASAPRPNIVFVLSDDMGWNQPGFNGGNKELTPNLDAFAASGLNLTRYYTHSVCAPTRGAFLTGRYAFRNWMDWRSEDFGKPSYLKALGLTLAHLPDGTPTRRIHALASEERTLAEALKEAGYFTALAGKWHCGEWLPEHLPRGQGFDHHYGHYAWGIDYWSKTIVHNAPARFAVYDWHRNGEPVWEEGYATDLFAAEAERVIAARGKEREKPFFLYLPFNAVHGPIDVVPRYTDRFTAREAALKCFDDAFGRVLKALDEHGFADNTLVVFANDNGGIFEEDNAPYRGTKNTTFEGGVRVPCVVRWPGKVEPGTSHDGLMFVADWFSTLIALGGGDAGGEVPIDGIDMSALLLEGAPSRREEIIFEVEGSVRQPTVLSGDWKLMGDLLFNIREDPSEKTDVAADNPAVVARLGARLEAAASWRPDLGDKPLLMEPALPYVYGQDENGDVPAWLKAHVDKVRAGQPQEWAEGETPWPQAPVGINANKQTESK